MKLTNILFHLYADPWPLLPEMHRTISTLVHDHLTGAAHLPAGRLSAMSVPSGKEDDEKAQPPKDLPPGIAQITIEGVIIPKANSFEKSCGATDLRYHAAALKACLQDDNCRGILLCVDSPGGAVTGVPEFAAALAEAAKSKPIVCFSDGLLASAAYWIASACREIVVTPTARPGSLGVYQAFLDSSRAHELAGYKMELFKTGKFKGMGLDGLPLTDDQRKLLQDGVDRCFAWFKAAVTAGRGQLPQECFEGQCFFADDARRLGLVDYIGTRADAIATLLSMLEEKQPAGG